MKYKYLNEEAQSILTSYYEEMVINLLSELNADACEWTKDTDVFNYIGWYQHLHAIFLESDYEFTTEMIENLNEFSNEFIDKAKEAAELIADDYLTFIEQSE